MSTYLEDEITLVQCADDDEHVFPARLLKHARWNGWLCPTFDLETTKEVIEWSNTLNSPIRLYWVGNLVVECDTENPNLEDGIYEPFIDDDGSERWPIGAYAWTWWRAPDVSS